MLKHPYKLYLVLLWKSRAFLLKVVSVGFFIGLIIFFSLPNEYKTSIFTVPESTSAEIAADEGLSTLGIVNSTRVVDAILPSRYPLVVSSVPFLTSLFDIPVTLSTNKEPTTITLYEYMVEHQQYPWWNYVISFPGKIISSVANLFQEKEILEETYSSGRPVDIFHLTRQQAAVAGAINRRIEVGVDTKRRTITLTVRMQDPLVAAIVADSINARLQAYVTNYRTKKEFNTVEYIGKIHEEARQRYHSSQESYAHFADRNRDLAGKVAQSELQKLRVEMNLAYSDYMRSSTQLQAAKGRAAKVRPVYTVIEPAKVPLKPVAPSPVKIVCVCVLLALLMGGGWIWVKTSLFRF